MKTRRTTLALAAALTLTSCAAPPGDSPGEVPTPDRAKNVIVLQGDGMGIAHRELIRLATVGQDGELAMDRLEVSGWVHTDPADPTETVTDSAAAATAYATGVRTFNGAVGVDVAGNPVPSLLERARDLGKSTGLVTTSQVTDATPAAFASHVLDRDDQSEIARQYMEETKPDVVLGGGEDRWLPPAEPGALPDHPWTDPTEESAGTAGDLVARAQELGYEHVSNGAELAAATSPKLLGLFANEEMFEHRNEGEGAIYQPSVPLRDMASKALDTLSADEDGFFLLIEEEGIDEMAHHNNAHLTIAAGAAFDATVALVLDFVKAHPDTLVVVEGDHETGGLTIENVDPDDESGEADSREDGPFTVAGSELQFTVDWTTTEHTGAATPLTATGPGSSALGRVQHGTDVHDAILAALH
ncbi:alkaline phosphatase [Kineococcus endophyticus]|uniref:Alkaline phosphatase n=1 Tax=Kineococcus endophyticus TaxID=1181883 RepID=A0ABV3PDR3_9ACTN